MLGRQVLRSGRPPKKRRSRRQVERNRRRSRLSRVRTKLPAQDTDIEVGPRQEESSTLTSLPSSAGDMDEGVSFVDTPAQASVGGAVKVEPPTEDRISDTPQPVIDVESLDETVTIKEKGPLSTVQEEVALEEKAAPPTTTTTPSSTQVSVIQDEPSRMTVVLDGNSPTSSVDLESRETQMNEAQAKTYVAGQVRRWEHELRERVLPPRVRYTWPNVGRDFEPWWTAMIATSRHREGRTASVALDKAWISDVQLVRLLATELIEWRQVAFAVTFQVVNIQDEPLTIQGYHAEDADGDLRMTDHEAGLIVNPTPSGHSMCRLVQYLSLSSLSSYHSSDTSCQSVVTLNETMSSIQNVSSRAGSDLVPSLFGTSHMPFRAYVSMVMTAQDGVIQANTQMGMQVVQTVLPPPPAMAELDDVVLSESGEVTIQSKRRSRHTRTQRSQRQKDNSPDGSSSGSDSETNHSQRKGIRNHRSSRKTSCRRTHSEQSTRPGRSFMSAASQVTLNTMRQTQEALARIQSDVTM
ncbi:hypothetical protein PHMEG_00022930 [Phytophthora megakarya]|uniref:Uncharacterized protein n=1 Tax=Phytophthora megakarya TaxID=4795 RepID=A0A225VIX2_9STRA|nr:hypothetical protein PHMEG_00022930 [Phytophthora megakarya]